MALALSTAPDISTEEAVQAPPPPAAEASAAGPKPAQHTAPGDPFERMNRGFFKFQDGFDRRFLGPTARAYKHKAPTTFQRMLHNFVTNFGEPVVVANDALQLRPKRAMTSAFRFVVNTTVGVAGLFDVAKKAGAEHHDNDFGITMGRYGIPSGPYLYVPLVGPSSVRDLFGAAVDGFVIDPLNWVGYENVVVEAHPPKIPHRYSYQHDDIPNRNIIRAGEAGLSAIDTRARVDEDLNEMMSTATDPYATMRSVYLQNRAAQVSQAHWRHSDLPDFETPADSPGAAPAAAAAAPPPPAPTVVFTRGSEASADAKPAVGAGLADTLRFMPTAPEF
jgi:phospholipid-binding lipoprotein MlaA